jgi:hypothetical protein
VGAIAGGCGTLFLFPLLDSGRNGDPNPTLPVLVHTALYTAIVGAGGLAFGFGMSRLRGAGRGAAAAALGGVAGALFYGLAHAFLVPLEWDFSPLPGTASGRFLILLGSGLSAAVCAAAVLAGEGSPLDADGP